MATVHPDLTGFVTDLLDGDNWTTDTSPIGPPSYVKDLYLANKIIITFILVFLMFGMGCLVQPEDFREVLRVPKSVLVGMLCQFLLLPLTAFCLALALSLPAPYAIGVLVTSCCPGGTTSNLFTFWTSGDVCLSITMTSLSTLAGIGLMPLNLFIYSRRWTDKNTTIPFVNIVIALVSILIPVGVGMLIRWKKKEWTKIISNVSAFLGLVGIVIAISITAVINPAMYIVSWRVWICVLTLPAFGGLLGYFIAWALRRSPVHCRTIAFETGFQNVGLAITLIVLTFDGSSIMLDILVYPSLYGPVTLVEGLIAVSIYKLVKYALGGANATDDYGTVDNLKDMEEIA